MAKTSEGRHTMTLDVKKFRAINSAQVDLDGITVIAGENGSGKSTLSKILYNTIRYSKKYELLIVKLLNAELGGIRDALYNSMQEIAQYGDNNIELSSLSKSSLSKIRRFYIRSTNIEDIVVYEQKLYSYLDMVKSYVFSERETEAKQFLFEEFNNEKASSYSNDMMGSRIRRIFIDALFDNEKDDDLNFDSALELLRAKISSTFERAYDYYNTRPIDLFSKEIFSLFHQPVEQKFNLIEYGLPITDWKENRFNNTNWIKNSIYVDTPMSINNEYSDDVYWEELNDELRNSIDRYEESSRFDEIGKVIDGDVYYERESLFDEGFKYRRNDERVFNIDECATGIKAFGILQLLLNNGKLTKDTLLIVDEPEAHLHPQWIVEYARIVVLLNKRLGVKFFIASHSPDMVSAIKYIAEKEEVSDRVNFYLAEKREKDYTYDYKSLKTDIEPIFSSFNIAIERINQYGVQDA